MFFTLKSRSKCRYKNLHFIFHLETSSSVTSSPAPGAFYSITSFIYNPYPTLRNYRYNREANYFAVFVRVTYFTQQITGNFYLCNSSSSVCAIRSLSVSLSSAISLPSSSREEKKAICRGLLFKTILIFVGNFLSIVVFALEKKLRKKILFLVVNMAFADIMLETVSLPLFVWYMGDGYPQLWTVTQDVLSLLGLFTITLISSSYRPRYSLQFYICERFYAVY